MVRFVWVVLKGHQEERLFSGVSPVLTHVSSVGGQTMLTMMGFLMGSLFSNRTGDTLKDTLIASDCTILLYCVT